jgi:hypothetical protein
VVEAGCVIDRTSRLTEVHRETSDDK